MHSHYTAYALHNAAYLQETRDATRWPETIDFSREKIDWLRLEITETKKGEIKDIKGVVVFKAFYRQDGEEHIMNEISRFTKINGRWFYLDGVIKSIGKVGLQTNRAAHYLSKGTRYIIHKLLPCPSICGLQRSFIE